MRRPPQHDLLGGLAVVLAAALLWAGSTLAQEPRREAPESASGWASPRSAASARIQMIAAANPLAVEAGLAILNAGGNAADAAVTVQLVLNLVEPQSSGIGGGAFALLWDPATARLRAYDGRETAPAAARPDRFLRDGSVIPYREAVLSGLSIGTPGALRLLETLHKAHGRLPWQQVVTPAALLAESGFQVSRRLHALLSAQPADSFSPAARSYFYHWNGTPWPEGYVLRNPRFGALLRTIAEKGADAFYAGPIAQAIVTAARDAPNRAGDLSLGDLLGYKVIEREPLCAPYRTFQVCSMGPPSSGGIVLAQTLRLLEPFDLGKDHRAAMNARALHLIAEAEKLAYADRNRYVADPDVVTLPGRLLDSAYLDRRRTLIDPARAMESPPPGRPDEVGASSLGADVSEEMAGTSHFSIVDRYGAVLALTTTIEAGFGSRVWAEGFLLNNQLTDFSLRPADAAGRPVANAVGPLKRPRSSMAPTIIFDAAGKPWAALGSVGGSRIPLYVLKTIVALIDWQLDPQAAAALMNFGSRGGPVEIEVDDPKAVWHALKLKPLGHRIRADQLTSGTHVVLLRPDGTLQGGADPRREGIARGD